MIEHAVTTINNDVCIGYFIEVSKSPSFVNVDSALSDSDQAVFGFAGSLNFCGLADNLVALLESVSTKRYNKLVLNHVDFYCTAM